MYQGLKRYYDWQMMYRESANASLDYTLVEGFLYKEELAQVLNPKWLILAKLVLDVH